MQEGVRVRMTVLFPYIVSPAVKMNECSSAASGSTVCESASPQPKRRRRETIFCSHCVRQVPKSTFYRHYRDFYNPVTKRWHRSPPQSDLQSTSNPNVCPSESTLLEPGSESMLLAENHGLLLASNIYPINHRRY